MIGKRKKRISKLSKEEQEEAKRKILAGLEKARRVKAEMSKNGTLKQKQTKLREEAEQQARELYFNKLIPKLRKLTDIQIEEALKPYNSKERMYVINQLVGKPTELQKISPDKQSVKDLEQKMRGWAGVKDSIERIKVEVSEAVEEDENVL